MFAIQIICVSNRETLWPLLGMNEKQSKPHCYPSFVGCQVSWCHYTKAVPEYHTLWGSQKGPKDILVVESS